MTQKNESLTGRRLGVMKHLRLEPNVAEELRKEVDRRGYPWKEVSVVNDILKRHFEQIAAIRSGKTQLNGVVE